MLLSGRVVSLCFTTVQPLCVYFCCRWRHCLVTECQCKLPVLAVCGAGIGAWLVTQNCVDVLRVCVIAPIIIPPVDVARDLNPGCVVVKRFGVARQLKVFLSARCLSKQGLVQ